MSECYGSTAENKEPNLQHMESGKHCAYQRVDLKNFPARDCSVLVIELRAVVEDTLKVEDLARGCCVT